MIKYRYLLYLASFSAFLLMLSNIRAMATSAGNILSKYNVVYVTCPDMEVSKKLAGSLVENNLAACVNIIPKITSVYKWEGKINNDEEYLLVIKSKTDAFEKLSTFVKNNHPYDVPEIISLPIQNGLKDYLDWINNEVNE